MEGTILVTPEILKSTANEFSNTMVQIQNLTSHMMDQVNGLNSKFQGEAATAYVNRFNMLQDDISKLAGMVNEHVRDLNEMATVYANAERLNEERANALSGDIII